MKVQKAMAAKASIACGYSSSRSMCGAPPRRQEQTVWMCARLSPERHHARAIPWRLGGSFPDRADVPTRYDYLLQVGYSLLAFPVVSCVVCVPFASITNIWLTPARSEEKMIFRPSGDQRGPMSFAPL